MALKAAASSKIVVAAVALLLIGGGIAGTFALGVLGAPSIESIDNRFGEVNETTTEIETTLVVNNPNPLGGSLEDVAIDYVVTMNGIEMAEGDREGVGLEQGNTTIRFVTHMDNERIPDWWVSHINEGERTQLEVDAVVHTGLFGQSVDAPEVSREIPTDIIEAFNSTETRPLEADREPVVEDPVLYLNSTSGSWGEVNDERTEIEMAFTIYNPKDYPIVVSEIGYDIRMNDIAVGSGQTDQSYTLPPGETTTVEATTVIDTQTLDDWWVSHLQNDQVTELEIDFYMQFDLSAVGAEPVRIQFDTLTQTIETDFFDNKDEQRADSTDETDEEDGSDGDSTDGTDDGGDADDEESTDEADSEDGSNGEDDETDGEDDETEDDETEDDDDGIGLL